MQRNFDLKSIYKTWFPLILIGLCLYFEIFHTFLSENFFRSSIMLFKRFSVQLKSISSEGLLYTVWFLLLQIGLPSLQKGEYPSLSLTRKNVCNLIGWEEYNIGRICTPLYSFTKQYYKKWTFDFSSRKIQMYSLKTN